MSAKESWSSILNGMPRHLNVPKRTGRRRIRLEYRMRAPRGVALKEGPGPFSLDCPGPDLAILLGANQSLQDVNHIFSYRLTDNDKLGLARMARVSRAIADGSFPTTRFSASLSGGKFADAFKRSETISAELKMSKQEVFAAALGILYTPSCLIDLFALSAVHGIRKGTDLTTSRVNATRTPSFLVEYARKNKTRVSLLALSSYGAVQRGLSKAPFGFAADEEKERFQRYQRVLEYVSNYNQAYSQVMKLGYQEKWDDANTAATKHLERIGLKAGKSLDNPPALADYLIIALTPVGDAQSIAGVVSKASK